MATAANSVAGKEPVGGTNFGVMPGGAAERGYNLNKLAALVISSRNNVARIERSLNMAKSQVPRFKKESHEYREWKEKLDKATKEHAKACAQAKGYQNEYDKLPTCAETLAGIAKFHERAKEFLNEDTLDRIIKAARELDRIGSDYSAYLSERSGVHAAEGLLSCEESFGIRARRWTAADDFRGE